MKKLLVSILSAALAFTFILAGCGDKQEGDGEKPKLATPTNLTLVDNKIQWSAVENATSYTVTYADESHNTSATYYNIDNTEIFASDFEYSVVAKADGYEDSDAATANYTAPVAPSNIEVTVRGNTEVGSGQKASYEAIVRNATNTNVTWSITEGSEYAEIDPVGRLTAQEVTQRQTVTIRATSVEDGTVFGELHIDITPRPVLTQEMLDEVASYGKMGMITNIVIDIYSLGVHSILEDTQEIYAETGMDTDFWYAKYTNTLTYNDEYLFYENDNGYAAQVGISYMNDKEYSRMKDDDGNDITWEAAGLYNNFNGANLTVADFTFDTSIWKYVYSGADETLKTRVVASANPYNFDPTNIALMIDDTAGNGVITGVYSVSKDDYGVSSGHRSVMKLTSYFDSYEGLEMPEITKFPTDEKHQPLIEALENMRSLESYKTVVREINVNLQMGNQYILEGYEETVTPDTLYYRDFAWDYDQQDNPVYDYSNYVYGFKNTADGKYNRFEQHYEENVPVKGEFEAYRAYAGSVDDQKPSFEFAAEIFDKYYEDPKTGEITYYSSDIMCGVASMFYQGVGNDIALYGLFATEYIRSDADNFTPYVTVKDGYIVSAGFYYDLILMYGIFEIDYSDFNTAELPETVEFTPREIPSDWSSAFVYDEEIDDLQHPADQVLSELLGAEYANLPFFGEALGDCFGFGMNYMYMPENSNRGYSAVSFYYDVPLDPDYTITTSMDALADLLEENGFEKTGYYEYRLGNIGVKIADMDLDFMVYVWLYQTETENV